MKLMERRLVKNSEEIICPLCASKDVAILSETDRHGAPLQSCCCKSCGMVFNNPIPNEKELRHFYGEKYRLSYKKIREPKRKHHVRYAGWVADQIAANPEIYRNARTMLDIGAGSGEALALFSQIGLEAEGIEPTKDYANYVSKTFGVTVFNGSVDDFKSDKTYDLIRLNHVLEHMRDPVEKLGVIRGFLSKNGILHVEVPDIRSYFQGKSPGRVFHYGHIYNFADETLSMTAARAGLREVARFGPTSIYFEQCDPFDIAPNPHLASELMAMNARHLAGGYQRKTASATKLLKKLTKRLSEQAMVKRLGAPTQIIGHFAEKVKASLA